MVHQPNQQTSQFLTRLTDSVLEKLFVLEFIVLCAIVLYNSEVFDVILDGLFELFKITFRYTDRAAVAYLIARGNFMKESEVDNDGSRTDGGSGSSPRDNKQ